jgi:AcrR family transcriptional regulator
MTEATLDNVLLSPRSQAKRQQILEAAQHLFLRDGFARTSMDAIRQEAQVSKPTLYTHFDSKENLFIGIIEGSLEDISEVWDGLTTETLEISSIEQLHAILLQFAKTGVAHLLSPRIVRLARTMLAEGNSFPELVRKFRERVPQRASRMIATLLTRAQDGGLLNLSQHQIATAVRFFQAQLLSYLLLDGLLVFESLPTPPFDDELEKMVDLYIEMIC